MDAVAIFFVIFLFVILFTFFGSFFTVKTAEVAVITRFGKFLRIAEPGLNWKIPYIDSVTGSLARMFDFGDHRFGDAPNEARFILNPVTGQPTVTW